jgi:hypothetical protein
MARKRTGTAVTTRDGKWQPQIRVKGGRVRLPETYRSKAEAKRVAKTEQAKADRQQLGLPEAARHDGRRRKSSSISSSTPESRLTRSRIEPFSRAGNED